MTVPPKIRVAPPSGSSTPIRPSWPPTRSWSASTARTRRTEPAAARLRRGEHRGRVRRQADRHAAAARRERLGRRGDEGRDTRHDHRAAGRRRRSRPGADRRAADHRDAAPRRRPPRSGRSAAPTRRARTAAAGGRGGRRHRRTARRWSRARLLGGYRFAGYKSKPASPRQAAGHATCIVHVPDAGERHGHRRDRTGGARLRGRGAYPGLGQHPRQQPSPARVRRAGGGARVRGRPRRRGARREAAARRRVRRHHGRRPGLGGAAAAGPDRLHPGRGRGHQEGRAGRQGHHVRQRRRVDQAGRRACGR